MAIDRILYDDLVATRRLYPGQAARVGLPVGPSAPDDPDDKVIANGEIVAPGPTEIALRLWQRIQGLEPGRPATVRIEVEQHAALYLADAGPVEPPYPGETFWAPAPFEWLRIDRRRGSRLTVDLSVRVALEGEAAPRRRSVLDLSASGCRVELVPADMGSMLTLHLALEGSDAETVVGARVVRSGGSGPSAWTALAFTDVDSASLENIRRFVAAERTRQLDARRLP